MHSINHFNQQKKSISGCRTFFKVESRKRPECLFLLNLIQSVLEWARSFEIEIELELRAVWYCSFWARAQLDIFSILSKKHVQNMKKNLDKTWIKWISPKHQHRHKSGKFKLVPNYILQKYIQNKKSFNSPQISLHQIETY